MKENFNRNELFGFYNREGWGSNDISKRPIDLFLVFGEPIKLLGNYYAIFDMLNLTFGEPSKLMTDSASGRQEDLACGETETETETPKDRQNICHEGITPKDRQNRSDDKPADK